MNLQEMILPVLVIYFVTMCSTAWKGIASNAVSFIKRQFFTTIYISNNNWAYYVLMDLFDSMNITGNLRLIRFQNGRWGESNVISIGFGTGFHIVKYRGRLLFINVSEKENHYYDESLAISITIFGADKVFVREFRKDIYRIKNNASRKDNEINVMTIRDKVWKQTIRTNKRSMDSIFIPQKQKYELLSRIEKFINGKEWYTKKGIPYQLGILLYGPPGSGKSSLVKAVASYFDKNICLLRASELEKIQEAIVDLPQESILVIEDIDFNKLVLDRDAKTNRQEIMLQTNNSRPNGQDTKPPVNLSDILNTFDGLFAPSGRILVMTTNHIEKIDPALIRPGRADLKLEVGYINDETFSAFIRHFYGTAIREQFRLKGEKLTISAIQNDYLANNLSLEDMLDKYAVIMPEKQIIVA
jgi:chaperone BCS1